MTIPPQIMMEGCRLLNVPTFKYLGIGLNQKLAFKDHVQKGIQTANHKLYILGWAVLFD